MGLFGSVLAFASLAITLSSANMFLTPLTPAGRQETTPSVTVASEWLCLVSVAMAICEDCKNAAPRCWIFRNPPDDAKAGTEESTATSQQNHGQNLRELNYLETTDALFDLP